MIKIGDTLPSATLMEFVEVEGNVHLDLDRAGLDSGARRRHRSEKGARGEGEKSNEKRAEHGRREQLAIWLTKRTRLGEV